MSLFNAVHRGLFAVGLVLACASARELPGGAEASALADTTGEIAEVQAAPDPVRVEKPAAASAQATLDARTQRRVRTLRNQGNNVYYVGTASMILGLGGMIVAANTEQAQLGQASAIAYLGGLPLLGIGADQVYKAYRLQNPYLGGDGRSPWLLYGLGWGSQTLGSALVFSGIVSAISDGFAGEEGGGEGGTMIAVGTVLFLGGVALHMVSWYQFSERRAEANDGISFSLEPMVPINSRGYADGAGLRLRARF